MAQISVVDAPQALPGKCYFCGTAEPDRGPYLDFGIDMEGYGVIYACKQDVVAIGNLFGLLDPVSSGDMQSENMELYLKNVELNDKVRRYENALNALQETGLFNGDNPSSSLSDPVDSGSRYVPVLDEPATEVASESNSDDAESLRHFDFEESGDAEPSDDKDLGELRPSSDDHPTEFEFDLSL